MPSVPVASFALLAVGLAGCATGKPAKEPQSASSDVHAEVGRAAPDLSIQSFDGRRHLSLVPGKVVIVDFWATWCQPCRKSFPSLEEIKRTHGDKVDIIALSVDDTKDGIADFVKETGVTFPVAWDEGHSIANRWGMGTMPTTFVVDGGGVVRYVHDGFHEDEPVKLAREVRELGEPPGAPAVARAEAKPTETERVAAAPAAPKKKRPHPGVGGKKTGKPRKKRA